MSHFSIAGLQLDLPFGNNLDIIGREIVKTKQRFPWIDMIVLSELAGYGPEKKYADFFPSEAESLFCRLAKENDVWIIPGSLYEKLGDNIYNTASVINNHGEVISRYQKIFTFLPYESGVTAGEKFVVFDVPQGRIGVAICYDLWFPEVARELTALGAEVLIYPTLTGTIDRPIEIVMAQATAATQQSYVLAINGAGELGLGQSVVAGPDGGILYQAGTGQEVIPIEIDFDVVRRNRARGLHGLGQPLKSFRDNSVTFSVYQQSQKEQPLLSELGTLAIPKKQD